VVHVDFDGVWRIGGGGVEVEGNVVGEEGEEGEVPVCQVDVCWGGWSWILLKVEGDGEAD